MDQKVYDEFKKTLDLRIKDDTTSATANYLPKVVANEIVKYIAENNWCRKLFTVVPMAKRVLPLPVISSGRTGATNGVYFVPRGTDITSKDEGNFIRMHSVQLEAKKLMAYAAVEDEDVEDENVDIIQYLFAAFGEAFGEAEEYAFLLGGDDASLPADNPAKAFTGLVKLAKDASLTYDYALTQNTNKNIVGIESGLSLGIKKLGKYGRNRAKLVAFTDSDIAEALRRSYRLVTVDNQSIRKDVGPSGLQAATVLGTKVYESAWLTGSQAGKTGVMVVTPQDEPVIGDRRKIKIVPKAVPESDKTRYIISERVAFDVKHRAYNAGLAGNAEAVVLVTFTGSLT